MESDTTTEVLQEAEEAYASVRALVELLDRCEDGAQLTAALFVGLLRDVQGRMFNVVDGLQVLDERASNALVVTE